MVNALFDTNILIDYLNGVSLAQEELGRYDGRAISIITWMEVMAGAPAPLVDETRAFLASFETVQIDPRIAELAVALRQQHRIKLPGAIIWASAGAGGCLLVTRNTRDFPSGDIGVRVPYQR